MVTSFASSQIIRMPFTSSSVTLSPQSSSSDPFPLGCPPQAQPFSQGLTASEIGRKKTEEGSRARLTPELGLEEGGAFPYLRASASPLVCSEIASLAPAQHKETALWALPSLPQTQIRRRTNRRQDAAMAQLPGPFLLGALLGFVCMSGEEGGRAGPRERWEQRPGFPAS